MPAKPRRKPEFAHQGNRLHLQITRLCVEFAPVLPADHGRRTLLGRVLFGQAKGIELPVKGRAADLEPAGNLGHLPAVVGDGETDDLRLDLLEGADLAQSIKQGQRGRRESRGLWWSPYH